MDACAKDGKYMINQREQIEILGIQVDHTDMVGAVEILGRLMESEGLSLIVTPNSEIIVNASKDPELARIIGTADLVIPDGIGLVYASKLLGNPLKERVTGIDFLSYALDWLEKNGKSIFLLGGKPGENGNPDVAALAAAKMLDAFPSLKIAGTHHGYFAEAEEPELIREINGSGADFLCVAMGSPKQEMFIDRNRGELQTKAAIGVGGSLDVWAGTAKRAPEFYRKHGLEWLYRFAKQPSRYKRMAALPLFMVKVLRNSKISTVRGEK